MPTGIISQEELTGKHNQFRECQNVVSQLSATVGNVIEAMPVLTQRLSSLRFPHKMSFQNHFVGRLLVLFALDLLLLTFLFLL